jgi:hypothetical protein
LKNTAPQQQQRKAQRENWMAKEKKERTLFKNRISAATERRREIEVAKKRPDLGEGGGECTYLHTWWSLARPPRRRDYH